MKEAILSVYHRDDLTTANKVKVKLTKDSLILQEISPSNHHSPLLSTTIDSLSASFSRQTTRSASTDSSSPNPSSQATGASTATIPSLPANSDQSDLRMVTISRQPGGGLGISVKGGAEHGIPVLISRVFSGQAADQSDFLRPGDAIIAVNGKKVEHMTHDDVVAELRSCGPEVTLTVRAFEGASRVLGSSSTPSTSEK